jgi:fumarate reductase flavoprotein subunit
MNDKEYFDLVVIGAGLAGLTAAARAHEIGKHALVLECETDPKHQCASRVNGGVFHLAFRSVMTNPLELAAEVISTSGGFVEPRLARAMAENAARSVSWLRSAGVELTPMQPDDGWKDVVAAPHGFHKNTSLEWRDLGADRMMDTLEAYVLEKGGTILRSTRATGLEMSDGHCRGVRMSTPHGTRTVRAGAVLLADGGFHGNNDMLREFVTPYPERLRLRGTTSGKGDGIRFAQAAGARLVAMEQFYGHIISADALTRESLGLFPFLDFLAMAGLIVDDNGERFVDEGRGGHAITNALPRHRNALGWVVFDDEIWNTAGRHFFCPPNPNLVMGGGTLYTAENLETLAAQAGLPSDTLISTVMAHNNALASHSTQQLSIPRSLDKHSASPILKPPFHAAPACAAITHTMGGVSVDDRARVLRLDGSPIAGLFAAGSTCGGLEGGRDAVYQGGLVQATVFGLLAAETACLLHV